MGRLGPTGQTRLRGGEGRDSRSQDRARLRVTVRAIFQFPFALPQVGTQLRFKIAKVVHFEADHLQFRLKQLSN